MLAIADAVAAGIASFVAASSMAAGSFWAVALLPLWILLAKLLGLYDRDHRAIRHLTVDELPSIAAWAASGVAVVALLLAPDPGRLDHGRGRGRGLRRRGGRGIHPPRRCPMAVAAA